MRWIREVNEGATRLDARYPWLFWLVVPAIGAVVTAVLVPEARLWVLGMLALLTALVFIIYYPDRMLSQVSRTFVALGTFIVVTWTWPYDVVSTEFYKAAAQIVPVLFLSMIIERGRAYQNEMGTGDRFVFLLTMSLLVAAGYVTLRVLSTDHVIQGLDGLVIAAIAMSVVFLVLDVLARSTPGQD